MERLNLPVEEFTTPNPVTASIDTPVDKLVQLMQEHEIRHIPIVKDNDVVGIISERDLRIAASLSSREKMQVRAEDIMVTNLVTVSSGASLDEVAFEMSQKKIGSVIVNDENDMLLGIFTVTDALNALIEITREKTTDH